MPLILMGGTPMPTVEVRPLQPPAPQPKDEVEEVYQALVLGTRDYALKNGFQQVLLGISGGIDSAVTAAIAAAALGPENVMCVTMPSRFNSPETIADAKRVADNLGCPAADDPHRADPHALPRVAQGRAPLERQGPGLREPPGPDSRHDPACP